MTRPARPSESGVRAASAAEGAVVDPIPVIAVGLVQDDEIVLLVLKPSLWFVVLSSTGSLMAIAILVLILAWASRLPFIHWTDIQAFGLGAVFVSIRLLWGVAEWVNRLYVLTDRRLIVRSGVIRLFVFQTSLRNIQHTSIFISLRERLLGLGTIGFATSGSDSFDAWWDYIRRPVETHRVIIDTIHRHGGRPD